MILARGGLRQPDGKFEASLGNSKTLSQNKNLKQIKYKNETKTEML
jgi:hypothetical protein